MKKSVACDPWAFQENAQKCAPWDLKAGVVVGGDVPSSVTVTEEEAAQGTTKQVWYWRAMHCPRCGGTGGEPGTPLTTCARCNGTGADSRSKKPGSKARKFLCTFCTGRGKLPTAICLRCKGRSVLFEEHVEPFQIPAGTEDDTELKVLKAGHWPSPTLIPGDLIVIVSVAWDSNMEICQTEGSYMYGYPPNLNEGNVLANLSAEKFIGFGDICTKMGIKIKEVARCLDVKLRTLELNGKVLVAIKRRKVMFRRIS